MGVGGWLVRGGGEGDVVGKRGCDRFVSNVGYAEVFFRVYRALEGCSCSVGRGGRVGAVGWVEGVGGVVERACCLSW